MKRLFKCLFFMALLLTQGYSQTNWTKHPDNPVFSRGSNGTWDDTFVSGPTISYDGEYYHMWYSGFDAENSGQNVGYAWSDDGINWNRLSESVLKRGADGSWDAVSVFQPSVIYDGTTYHMWFCGHDGSLHNRKIGYATSPDSVHWTKYEGNPVLGPGTNRSWDDDWVGTPEVLLIDGVFHMWYSGYDGVVYTQVGHATSSDGITWEKDGNNPVLKVGGSGTWDYLTVGGASVLYDGQTFHMWYTGGVQTAWDWKIGYAYSPDGSTWTRDSNTNPVLGLGDPLSWDDTFVGAGGPEVIFNEDSTKFKMWYGGGKGSAEGDIGYATAPDTNIVGAFDVITQNFPYDYKLDQNYPNPFNPSTNIKFSLPKPENVKIEVYNIIGQKIQTLLNQPMPAGYHELEFNGQNLSSGIYLYRIETGAWTDVKKMILLR